MKLAKNNPITKNPQIFTLSKISFNLLDHQPYQKLLDKQQETVVEVSA